MRLLDRVNGKLDAEMCGVWVCDPDLQHGFSAAVPVRGKSLSKSQGSGRCSVGRFHRCAPALERPAHDSKSRPLCDRSSTNGILTPILVYRDFI